MITQETAEIFISIITFLMAYLVVITGANVFRAWAAMKMGDDTGARLGFLTINPIVHIDPIGIFCLFIFYFGWGRMVPIFPFNITHPFKRLKLAVAYFSDTFAHFFQAIIGIVVLLALFNIKIIKVVQFMVLTHNVSYLLIANMYPDVATLSVAIGFIMFALVYLNVILGALTFIINSCHYLLIVLSDYYPQVGQYANYITFGLPIFLILFFSGTLRLMAVTIISSIGFIIAHMLGIAG